MEIIKRLWHSMILFVILFVMVSPVFAAFSENLIIHHIESIVNEGGDNYTVSVLLSALNQQQLPITDLTERDFTVSEDSQSVDVESVELMRDLPISVILVMDISGSMQGDRLRSARTAISQFIKSLYRGDKISIFTFNTELEEIISLTNDLNAARDNFDNAEIYAGGGTCLFDATYAAAQRASELPPGRQAVIVLSDGWDTINGSDICSTRTVEDIITLAGGADIHIPIYTIGIGTDIDRENLGKIAEETGGVFAQSTINADLPQLFEQLANRLSSQYKLTFISHNDPGEHILSVSFDENSSEREFVLPGLPPVVSIAYPEEDQVLEPGINRIMLSLVERGIAVDALVFKINGVAIGVGGPVGQPPYEYEIDFSQYVGQEVELTIVALDNAGEPISETTTMLNLTGEAIVESTQTRETEEISETEVSSDSCPDDSFCFGNLQLTYTQLIIAGAVLLATVIGVILIVFFTKNKNAGQEKKSKKESLFDDATVDGFALPENKIGRLTILSSDDPLMVGKEFQLTKSPTVIGRSVNNDIALPKDSAVSRQHIQILEKDGQSMLREVMKSLSDGTKQPPTYGTYINDRKVTGETILHTGDEISLGRRTKLRFENQVKPDIDTASEDVTMDQINLPDLGEVDDATRDG